MGFDSGNINFRLFYLTQTFGPEVIEAFARRAAPPIESLGRDPIHGWVSGRHLLDRDLSEENCVLGSYLHVCLMRAERKIPESLLRAHCRIEEQIELRARNATHLPRPARAEIKARVVESLLPTMPPTLTGMPVTLDFRSDLLYAGAMSDRQIDVLGPYFRDTTGTMPVLLNADTAALKRRQVNANDLDPVCFSPDPAVDGGLEPSLGMDFLTWLWYYWETDGGNVRLAEGAPFSFMLEGPLTFFREGQGAHEAVLRKGSPLNSREGGTALRCGKKLKRAKLILAQGEHSWSATVDADFGFRALKLPKSEQFDPLGHFQERMLAIEFFVRSFLGLYDRFLDLRRNRREWPQTVAAVRTWVGSRA
jgi:hypothetical protein